LEELPTDELKPQPLLTGADLIAEGYQPGPAFARMLALAEDAQLESRIHTREQALELVRSKFQIPDGAATQKQEL
jgi:poly(A) polymerase